MRVSILELHPEKISPEPNSGCWLWTAALRSCGYGSIRFRQKNWRAHRVSYILSHGEIPDGMHVLHKCDVPCCVNPSHLSVGTHNDNMADMKAKKRYCFPAVLSLSQVHDIRRSDRPAKHLARELGVGPTAVRDIRKGRTWVGV